MTCVCFDFPEKLLMHTYLAGKTKKKEKHVETSEQSSHQFIHTSFVSVDFGKNMPDSCTVFGCTNRRSTTFLQFYCISSARRYPEQRITKWVTTAKNDQLRK